MARTGLRMMPTFPSPPLRFRTAGFPQYGSKAGISDGAFPRGAAYRVTQFATVLRATRGSVLILDRCRGHLLGEAPPFERLAPSLPQGPSLRVGFFCPVPSTLNRPHPPRSPARRSFPAWPVMCGAIAVPVSVSGLGSQRVVPSFRCALLLNMSPSMSPGSLSLHTPSSFATSTGLRRETPTARRSRWQPFRGLLVRICCNLLSGSPPSRRLLLPGFRRVGHPSRRRI